MHEISRSENALVAAAAPVEKLAEIKAAIIRNIEDERHLRSSVAVGAHGTTNQRTLIDKFTRADATEHFESEVIAARQRIDQLNAPFRNARPGVSPGPRITEQLAESQATVDGWEQSKKLCHLGEDVFRLRQERRRLEDERDQLEKDSRQKALAC